ncbi:hypothetical protein MN608_00284 [Microdochium nivale]|nr:hypothetical protein MN608_00284 [Microdochium nivale]
MQGSSLVTCRRADSTEHQFGGESAPLPQPFASSALLISVARARLRLSHPKRLCDIHRNPPQHRAPSGDKSMLPGPLSRGRRAHWTARAHCRQLDPRGPKDTAKQILIGHAMPCRKHYEVLQFQHQPRKASSTT